MSISEVKYGKSPTWEMILKIQIKNICQILYNRLFFSLTQHVIIPTHILYINTFY